jgi:peptidoglycan/xylan/chitin deacetylase (PgdA/CDA1 family)
MSRPRQALLRLMPLAAAAAMLLSLGSDVAGATAARVVSHGSRDHRVVALTFDDGYGVSQCQSILHTLTSMHVKATFFPNSDFVRVAPAFWRHVAALGFPIGNHTAAHPDLTKLSARRVQNQISRDERVVEAITGHAMIKVLRPPYGVYDRTVLRIAGSLGYRTVLLWDTDSGDTSGGSDAAQIRSALRGTNGSIVIMHCGPSSTPRILSSVIRGYRKRGFTFVTVPALLAGT